MLSDSDLAQRTAKAVDAARAAARRYELDASDTNVLYDAFSVVIHLAPSPVVARIPVVAPFETSLAGRVAKQRTELAVAGWLADRGEAVVPPSPIVPREPIVIDGLSVSLWQYVDADRYSMPDFVQDVDDVARLHSVLRECPEKLPFFGPMKMVAPLLERLAGSDLIDDTDLERANREWEVIAPLFESVDGLRRVFPEAVVQPIHGDSPLYNQIILTDGSRLFSDFEEISYGVREWDVALATFESLDIYDREAENLGLAPLDRELLRVMDCGHFLQAVACLALVPDLPMLADGLAPSLEMWRQSPFAGGLV